MNINYSLGCLAANQSSPKYKSYSECRAILTLGGLAGNMIRLSYKTLPIEYKLFTRMLSNASRTADESLHEILELELLGVFHLERFQLVFSRLLAMDPDK